MVYHPKKFLLELLPDTALKQWVNTAIPYDDCLPPNPRQIKGFANLFQRFAERYLPAQSDGDDPGVLTKVKLIFIVAYVYQFHHNLYRLWEANPEVYDHLLRWARGGQTELTRAETESEKAYERELLLFKLIERLRRPWLIKTVETTAVPQYRYENAFPDPADRNVLWIQRLIHQVSEEGAAKSGSFVPYLRGDQRPAEEST
jgi:hypothetical protein